MGLVFSFIYGLLCTAIGVLLCLPADRPRPAIQPFVIAMAFLCGAVGWLGWGRWNSMSLVLDILVAVASTAILLAILILVLCGDR